jgi:hypothetical protein
MAYLVNPQPGFLQQVIGVGATVRCCKKKPAQVRTDALNESLRGGEVALLIADHQHLEIFAGVHAMDIYLGIFTDVSVFAQIPTTLAAPAHRPLAAPN